MTDFLGLRAPLVITALLFATTARADAIDGNWCHADGRHLSIRVPENVTPGSNRIAGQYSRHAFSYTVPGSEPNAGQTVFMILYGEYLMRLRIGEQPSGSDPNEVWRRCAATTS
jgi:hypothetical protein